MRRVGVNQLRSIAQQQLFELVDVRAGDVPADQPRAGVAERLDRAEIAGPIDDHRVARIDQAAREQIEPLLRAGEDEDVLGIAAEPVRERGAEPRHPFGRPVTPRGAGVLREHAVHRPLERLEREMQSSAGSPAASDIKPGSEAARTRSRTVVSVACSAEAAILPRQANGALAVSGFADTNVPRPT